jgi:hypothetical protein
MGDAGITRTLLPEAMAFRLLPTCSILQSAAFATASFRKPHHATLRAFHRLIEADLAFAKRPKSSS